MATRVTSDYYNLITLGAIQEGTALATALTEKNPIIADAVVLKANEKHGHTGTRTVVLPGMSFRRIAGYRTAQVAQYTPFHEDLGIINGASVVPEDVIFSEGMGKFLQTVQSHREGYAQSIANHWFNGDASTSPILFDGFGVRYNTPDNDTGSNSPENPDTSTAAQVNVYNAGGTGSDTMSIWFFRWGDGQVNIRTPLNHPQYGLTEKDEGRQKEQHLTTGNSWRWVYQREWEWWHGICVENQQCVARIRNIESSLSSVDATLNNLIIRCLNEGIGPHGTGTIWMYVPRRMQSHFQIMLMNKQNVIFSRDNPYNLEMMSWGGTVPIQICDALTITETAVTAV